MVDRIWVEQGFARFNKRVEQAFQGLRPEVR
jgi:hypothetical protein